MEKEILAIFREVLGRSEFGPTDHFFSAGGDSLDAARVLARVEMKYGVLIPLGAFTVEPTAGGLAAMIKAKKPKGICPIVAVRTGRQLPPLFLVHPHDGQVMLYFKLVKYLDDDVPVYAFQAPDREFLKPGPGRIEEIAQYYVREMTARHPQGPHLIGGFCFGAWIALEMAKQMEKQNRRVKLLALLDAYAPGYPLPREDMNMVQCRFYLLLDRLRRFGPFLRYTSQLGRDRKPSYLTELIKLSFRDVLFGFCRSWTAPGRSLFLPGREEDRTWEYHPEAYAGPVVVFRPSREPLGFQKAPMLGWERYIKGGIKTVQVPGYHRSLIFEPSVRSLGGKLMDSLREAV
jgi:thioesterase domain-containing protein/acyl carrier protein